MTAADDPAIKSIVLNIDSPGGQATGIAEFAELIQSTDKPVIAYVDGMGASAAYWIAAAADQVILSKTAMVGSIGAVVSISTYKAGGEVELVSSQSPNKRPDVTTEEGRSQVQARLDNLAQVFIDDVAEYRGVTVEKVLADFGQGDIRMGAEAVALGMADGVSTLEKVIAGLAGATEEGLNMSQHKRAIPAASQKPGIGGALAAEGDVTVTAVEPSEGPKEGGTAITITGTGFTNASEVTIGGVAAVDAAVVDDMTITATTPAGEEGAQDVSVTSPLGMGIGAGMFTYVMAGDEEEETPAPAPSDAAAIERERIKSVFAQALPGHEALIQKLAFDGKTTGPEAAVAVLNAERQKGGNILASLKADAPKPVQAVTEPVKPVVASGKMTEEQLQVKWDADPQLQSEFGSFSTYLAYESNKGNVKILGKAK